MKKITLLGAGMVGRAMAIDLSEHYLVNVLDVDREKLNQLSGNKNIRTITGSVFDDDVFNESIKDCDIVLSAVPGFIGFEVLKKIISAGKNVVDISFFSEDAFELDELAKQNNVTAVVDCGVAPGMSNIILGYHNTLINIKNFECYVGGLPIKRTWPYQYKAPFSPIDVIEEYIRPARIKVNGKIEIREALSEPELIEFDEIGTLEAFNSDGLRSLLKTMNIENMKEKTLRYPGHIEYIKVLRESGFFSKEEIDVNGVLIKPIDLSAKLLFPLWKLKREEEEFTVMKIIITGSDGDGEKTIQYFLFDRYDIKTQTSSMARTTGYTATAAINLFLNKKFTRNGICPPEFIGSEPGCFEFVWKYLASRGVNYNKSEMK